MMTKKKPEFENGWRVLAYLPVPARPGAFGTQRNLARVDPKVGTVEETVSKRTKAGPETWVRVNIEGTRFLVPEPDVDHKTDEPYCVDFVKELQQASLVRKSVRVNGVVPDELNNWGHVERERIVTPSNEKGFLKALNGPEWKDMGRPVNRMQQRALDETYKRLTTQAASAGK